MRTKIAILSHSSKTLFKCDHLLRCRSLRPLRAHHEPRSQSPCFSTERRRPRRPTTDPPTRAGNLARTSRCEGPAVHCTTITKIHVFCVQWFNRVYYVIFELYASDLHLSRSQAVGSRRSSKKALFEVRRKSCFSCWDSCPK